MKTFILPINERLINAAIDFGGKLLNCLIVFVICMILVKISRSLVKKFFQKQAQSRRVPLDERKANTMNSIACSLIKYLLYFVALFTVLNQLGIEKSSLIAIAGAGSVAIGLGAQNMIQDMLDGFFILFEDHFGIGDMVVIQGTTGEVESITLRSTKIRDANGAVHIFPNGSIGTVSNMSKSFINAIVDVDIDYSEKTDKVIQILQNEMEQTKDMKGLLETPVVLGITGLNESAVTLRILAKCEIKENYAIERELRLRVKNRLDKEQISIPFPQRTIHIVKE